MRLAERKLRQSRERVDKHKSKEGKAFYYQRKGAHLIYSRNPERSIQVYDRSIALFEDLGNSFELAKSLMGRGVAKSILHRFDDGLADEERALQLIGLNNGIYLVMGLINVSSILTQMGKGELARAKVDQTQGLLRGMKNIERPKLLLRWIKSLLLEATGARENLKLAGQMIDRIEGRMKKLEMKAELRVLLADRARIARDPTTIKRIAARAYEMEESAELMILIKAVIHDPTRESVVAWRNALDAYVPPFPATA